LNNYLDQPPFCVWQTGKSFRREQDQVTKNMRLKEFYQQEFQCIYTAETLNDYQHIILEPVQKCIQNLISLPTRIVDSDRLPSYSLKTLDVEVDNGDKWMEVCSISKRTDFPQKATFQTKKGAVEKDLLVLEVAIGLDRLVYNYNKRTEQ
jgi:glycyl-tRNA synthetase